MQASNYFLNVLQKYYYPIASTELVIPCSEYCHHHQNITHLSPAKSFLIHVLTFSRTINAFSNHLIVTKTPSTNCVLVVNKSKMELKKACGRGTETRILQVLTLVGPDDE